MSSPEEVDFAIEPLSDRHKRSEFSSGVEALDRYLQRQASQDKRKYVAAPFVAIDCERDKIIGYYTLSATSIDLEDLPDAIANKLPKYPILPAILLGRLAVDRDYQKQGWGDLLLMDALYRSLQNEIAAMAVVVDAKDERSASFYEYYEFMPFSDTPYRLFLPMKTIEKMFKSRKNI